MEQQFHQISYPIHLSHSRKLYTARKFLAKKIGILISMSIFEKGYKKYLLLYFRSDFINCSTPESQGTLDCLLNHKDTR